MQVVDDWAAFMQGFLEREDTMAERLAAYIRSRLAYMRDNQSRLLAVAEIVDNHRRPDGVPVFPEGYGVPLGDLEATLRAGQGDGEFREFDPAVLAMTITQGIDGALTYWAKNPGTDLTAYGEELVALFDLATQKRPTAARGAKK
ncbi:MAG: hypothetical protein QOG10_2028 [Kribbellaceae bacterium]|nr:hypothetical protein [Kribbellaceae bacterium]